MASGAAATNQGHTSGQPHDRIPVGIVSLPATDDEETEQHIEVSIGSRMLSAVIGSVLTSLLVTPLDVVRVRLQSQSPISHPPELRANPDFPYPKSFENLPPNLGITQCCKEVFWVNNNSPYCVVEPHIPGAGAATLGHSGFSAAAEACAVDATQSRNITSTLDGLRKIARNEGLTTLWRGLSPTLAMAVPGNVVYFAGYDWLRTSPNSPFHPSRIPDYYAPLIAGSSARIAAAFCVSPIELFRTRMQASRATSAAENFKETVDSVREMVKSQGPRSLWRGLTLTLWRDVPFSAFYWWGYEAARNGITDIRESRRGKREDDANSRTRSDSRRRQNHTSTLIDSFLAGGLAGGIAAIATTPFDVGKTRQQVLKHTGDSAQKCSASNGLASTSLIRPEDRSMPRFLWHIFKEEGMGGLFKGWAARTLKVAPACAIMISTYELGKKYAQTKKLDMIEG